MRAGTKDRILACATRLFAQKGYAATSIKEICAAAGTDIAAIHYHFRCKEDLYRCMVEQFASVNTDGLCQLLRPPKTRDEFAVRLETFLQVSVDHLMRQPELTQMILRDRELTTGLCRDVFEDTFQKLHQALVAFFEGAQKNHLFRPGIDAGLATLSFHSQILYLSYAAAAIKSLRGADVADPGFRERWKAHVLDVLCHGLLK